MDEYADDLRLAEAYYRGADHRAAVELATRLLEVSPWSAQLRQLRAECYIALVSSYVGLTARYNNSVYLIVGAKCQNTVSNAAFSSNRPHLDKWTLL